MIGNQNTVGDMMMFVAMNQKIFVRIITRDDNNVALYAKLVPVTGPIRTTDDGDVVLSIEAKNVEFAERIIV